ncbi:YitT family protein [Brevibacillus sp. SYP-B805]|uniref:YitT family protein n=1 Tax=Brevibacillus sp. SYP-B805 TaxID=1578199 RepID=UPI0013EDFA41|nr:YitT family protein [Brevibacillus sp. SYP-B805]NGQ95424.1 YitT family protein [Brevibacillus sp. SYP-B805]
MNGINKAVTVLLGSVLVGVGVNWLLIPHRLMDGGMIGIGLLAKYYLQLSPGLIMLAVSIPIYGIVFLYDRSLFYNSFHGLFLTSFFIDLLSPLRAWNPFPIEVSAVTGGVMIGAGIGSMLAYRSNTGGTDLLAQFLAYRTGIPVALLILLIDGVIVVGSWEAIGTYRMVFSVITIMAVAAATHAFSRIGKPKDRWEIVRPPRR